jgi:hypothetical protein
MAREIGTLEIAEDAKVGDIDTMVSGIESGAATAESNQDGTYTIYAEE